MATAPAHQEIVRHFSSPQEEVLLSLIRSADCLQREFQHRLRPFGLTPTQYNVLRILRGAQPDGLTCSAIGRSMITPEPDITRLLARLKEQKLLTQQRDPHDRRVLWTHISEAGLELLARLDATVERAPRDMFSELSCEEVIELTRLLHKAQCCRGSSGDAVESGLPLAGTTGRQPSLRPLRLPHRPE